VSEYLEAAHIIADSLEWIALAIIWAAIVRGIFNK